MNKRELNRERRRQRAFERLGTNTPFCVMCGFHDPAALELHHIAGRAHGNDLAIVCCNCHRLLSDAQKDHALRPEDSPTDAERIGHFLMGLADLFELSVKRLREFATKLVTMGGHRQDRGRADDGG
jgi:hypothetical protein